MLVKICTDIWRDVFDWLSLKDRRRLALKFNEVKDREFSDLCQKWLHEWTKNVCLEKLLIDGNWDTKLARLLNREQKDEVPFAEVEMPANINDFERIRIRYLNTSALNFLRQLQPLFRGVNLHVYFYEKSLEATRTALTDLMPLFSGDGIEFLVLLSSSMLPTIRDNFQAQFLGIKILSMYGHAAGIDEFAEFYLPWLSTRRADGQPRTLAMRYDDTSIMEITDRIRQDFLNPTSGPISFFIRLHLWNWNTNPSFSGITESITKNASGEQLMVYHDVDILLIGRCPAEVNGQTWIVEMERKLEEANDSKKRTITIAYPMIGQIEEAQQQMDQNQLKENGEEEDADQPGPSNRF